MTARRFNAEDLAALVDSLDGIVTTIPDQVTQYYMKRSGIETDDAAQVKVMSLAAQRFIEALIRDALKIQKRQDASKSQLKGKDSAPSSSPVLTTELLATALQEYGINLGHQAYFSDDAAALHK
ncbi:hypothetical protein WJX73_003182 [Symbiochloris irregularis]|uniref:Transcription initiation factor TFIID subunit 10 n=1 Tax=Symbiochloris irregularis TaxID=706552 RepID=A0AAW1NTB7_9CHLO